MVEALVYCVVCHFPIWREHKEGDLTMYEKGMKFIVRSKNIVPIPVKFQEGVVKFRNNPNNHIQGLDKLNKITIKKGR